MLMHEHSVLMTADSATLYCAVLPSLQTHPMSWKITEPDLSNARVELIVQEYTTPSRKRAIWMPQQRVPWPQPSRHQDLQHAIKPFLHMSSELHLVNVTATRMGNLELLSNSQTGCRMKLTNMCEF